MNTNTILIGSQEDYDKIVKSRQHIGKELVIENSKDFIVVRTDVTVGKDGKCETDEKHNVTITARDNGIVAATGKSVVTGYDKANIIAKGNCKVTLNDNAFANCYEHCQITLNGASKVSADGNCTVHAYDESTVSATGSSKVYANQNANAKGTDVTSLSGKDAAFLRGEKNCSIMARDSCIVYASDNCAVQASDNCLVVAKNNAKIVSQDNCLVMSTDTPDISIQGKCEHVNIDNVTDKNIMGTLKQMAQSKAAIERPYIAIQILKESLSPTRREAVDRRLSTMGIKDQSAAKKHLYSLVEAVPNVTTETSQGAPPNFEQQLEMARKAGYVQGVAECVAVVGEEKNLGKKLLAEMNVSRDMVKKFAAPETYKTLEKGVFAQNQEQKLEQARGVKR